MPVYHTKQTTRRSHHERNHFSKTIIDKIGLGIYETNKDSKELTETYCKTIELIQLYLPQNLADFLEEQVGAIRVMQRDEAFELGFKTGLGVSHE